MEYLCLGKVLFRIEIKTPFIIVVLELSERPNVYAMAIAICDAELMARIAFTPHQIHLNVWYNWSQDQKESSLYHGKCREICEALLRLHKIVKDGVELLDGIHDYQFKISSRYLGLHESSQEEILSLINNLADKKKQEFEEEISAAYDNSDYYENENSIFS